MKRQPRPKQGELVIWYGRLKGGRPDIIASWGGCGATKSDGYLVLSTIAPPDFLRKERSLLKELEERGYDLTTMEFRIRKTKHLPWKSINEEPY